MDFLNERKGVVDFSAKEKIIRSQSVFAFCIGWGIPNQISFLLQDAEKVNRVQKITTKFRKHLSEVIRCESMED